MSASYLVDLQNTTTRGVSIKPQPLLSGSAVFPCSGAVIGDVVDLLNANTYCNLWVAGVSASGQLRVQVQVSDSTTSGSFTDPTSGFAPLDRPGVFQSGTILWINSGGTTGGLLNGAVSGEHLASGFLVAQGFVRTGRYARAIMLSGDFAAGPITAGFVSQSKTTASGGGYSTLPTSGSVDV